MKRLALFRACLLIAGAGQMLYTTGDRERLELKLEACDVVIHAEPGPAEPSRRYQLRWEGCGDLARELGTAGALVLAGVMRMPRPAEAEMDEDHREPPVL